MAVLEYTTHLDCSVESLFDFLSRPGNLATISDPSVGITFLTAPEIVQSGSRIEFQIVTFGQIVKATHEIIEFNRPRLVVEQQVTGPMRSWIHRHEYEATESGALKRDIVDFETPAGLIGLLVTEQKVKDHLEEGFFYREQRLKELVERGDLK